MTYYELTGIIDHVVALLPFISYKHLTFMFSGYGAPGKQHYDYVRDDKGRDEGSSEEDDEKRGDNEDTSIETPKEDMSGKLYTQEG